MKKNLNLINLLLVFTFILLFSISSSVSSFAVVSPSPQNPTIGSDEFLFIDTHTRKNGVGDVGPGMMIDFPTYFYSTTANTLTSDIQIPGYNSDTKVIVGSGVSITGTAGGGAATGLKAYDSFSSEGLFFVDPDLTVHYYMAGDWRVVAPGETWTMDVEQQPEGYTGKFIYTYRITNYGIFKKSNLVQPSPSPTAKPTPANKYKICGQIKPALGTSSDRFCSGFKVEIPEIGLSALTDPTGYYEIPQVPEKTTDTPYTLKISKPGYLTRSVTSLWIDGDTEIGSIGEPASIIPGDINDDGAINMADIFLLAKAFNTLIPDSESDLLLSDAGTLDLNCDKAINMIDVMIVAINFNKTSSVYTPSFIAALHNINLKVNDSTDINLLEYGVAGITWKYTISNESIIKFISTSTGARPDEFVNRLWTFKAISKGSAEVVFKPSSGNKAQKYIVTVTENTMASPVPSSPYKELPVVDSKELKSTVITTDSEQMIVPGRNLVFCPTFQMAWDELKNIIGGDIKLSGEPPLVTTLNKGFPMSGSLSPESYIAMSGYGQETVDKINSALKSKFGDSAPQLTEKLEPADIIAYSYLCKNACFAKAFESISTPLNFTSGNISAGVKSFGIPYHSNKAKDLAKQVKIYDYKSKDNFIVKLIPENDTDEIILAKTAPQESLYKTYTSVMNRINNTTPSGFCDYLDMLQIPVLDFNISHNYTDLEGNILQNQSFTNYSIITAKQRTRFKLDENGAALASEAIIVVPPKSDLPEKKELVFDGPFMIILKEKNAVNPYLMIWVDNPELLCK